MAFKRAEAPRRKKHKQNTENKRAVHQKSTLEDMRARAEQLFVHSDHYESMGKLTPFIKFVSEPSFCDVDPEGALLILHNCLVMRTNKGFVSDTAEIVKGIRNLLNDKKSTGYIMTRLENAANVIAGEERIDLDRADQIVGFSLKKPKSEGPIRSSGHETEKGPTEKDLEKIASSEDSD